MRPVRRYDSRVREVEVKLRTTGVEDARSRLERAGAAPVSPRRLEDNQLYDDAGRTLKARRRVLRLRSVGDRHLVTFKKPVDDAPDASRYKVRIEHETTVGDPEAFDQLIRGLGFLPYWRYQKHRQLHRLGEVEIALDETPIGVFLELEGPAEAINAAAQALGFGPRDYITRSYRGLFEEHTGASEPGDMLFPAPEP